MNAVYLETSAVLAWLFNEDGAERTLALMNARGARILTSLLTGLEARRAMRRAHHAGNLTAVELRVLEGLLSKALTGWDVMAVTTEVIRRAGEGFPVEPVRALDAIHLATALEFTAVFPRLRIASFDRRVRDNATALGWELHG